MTILANTNGSINPVKLNLSGTIQTDVLNLTYFTCKEKQLHAFGNGEFLLVAFAIFHWLTLLAMCSVHCVHYGCTYSVAWPYKYIIVILTLALYHGHTM